MASPKPASPPDVSAARASSRDDINTPPWTKAGIVACLGFVVGVLWPRAFGVHLSQTAPGLENAAASAEAASAASPSSVTAAPIPTSVPGPTPSTSAAPAAAPSSGVTVTPGVVLSCRTAGGGMKKDECGGVDPFSETVVSRLSQLASCPAAKGVTGKLSIVATVDFAGKRVDVAAGRSSTVPSPDKFLPCVNQALLGIDLSETHDFPRYVVAFAANFTGASTQATDEPAPAQPVAPPAPTATTAAPTQPAPQAAPAVVDPPSPEIATSGTGQVAWNTGVVRAAPTTGEIVARLKKGTKVTVVGAKDANYHIKFDGGEGWIARDALTK